MNDVDGPDDPKGYRIPLKDQHKYKVRKRGLLYLVYFDRGNYTMDADIDSSWEDEQKANEHCRLLNNG